MAGGLDSFVGRRGELAELRRAVSGARSGRGRVVLVSGEPGIGKSRLVDEATRDAEAVVLRGRCWEAGSAPAYFPWVQILRALLKRRGAERLPPGAAANLAELLPELRAPAEGAARAHLPSPDQERLQLLDAVVGTLTVAAAESPLVVVLEDLHAADPASLLLLDYLASQIDGLALCVLGTCRDAELLRGEAGPLLRQIGRKAHTLRPGRLPPDEVRALLRAAGAPDSAALDALARASEGHPLFAIESARWVLAHGADAGRPPLPANLAAVIRERVGALPEGVPELLEAAAVVGRDFELDVLSDASGLAPSRAAALLDDAVADSLVVALGRGQYRFAHALYREVIDAGIEPSRASALHRAVADALGRREPVAWASIADHLLRAGPGAAPLAIGAAGRAAEVASRQLAFEDAVRWRRTAAEVHERSAPAEVDRRGELRLAVAEALFAAGALAEGRAACLEVARDARTRGAPELLARAALTYGGVFVVGNVDAALVELLESALAAAPRGDVALRALLLSRLAAARQPAVEPSGPIEMARQAVELARTAGDDDVLLATLRSAGSAMADFADPRERLPVDEEYARLAGRSGDAGEELRATMRVVFDCHELGLDAEMRAALARCDGLARTLDHPWFGWRVEAAHAMRADYEGRWADAEEHARRAAALAERAHDPNTLALALQRHLRLRLRGRRAELEAEWPALSRRIGGSTFGWILVRLFDAELAAHRGDAATARALLDDELIDRVTTLTDLSLFELAADAAATARDVRSAARLRAAIDPPPRRSVSWGSFGMTVGPPATRLAAVLASVCGDAASARAHFDAALVELRRRGARPHLARALVESVEADPSHPEADARLEAALDLAAQLEIDGLRERIHALRRGAAPPGARPRPHAPDFRLERTGELWTVGVGPRSFHLRHTRGLQMLAQLLTVPRQPVHVLELSGSAQADRGDAGELIDNEARDAYRRRAEALRDELEEAEDWNDPERAARARSELEALEEELARSVALGGRLRRAGSAVERARVNVQRRLKDAVDRIAEQDEELGRHLRKSLRTGAVCCYDP